jgi:hypothetical protein
LPTQPSPVRLPCHRPMQRPCTRDPRRAPTGASPVQYRSGRGHPRSPRTLTPLPRLRPLPKPRPTGHCRELWHGG